MTIFRNLCPTLARALYFIIAVTLTTVMPLRAQQKYVTLNLLDGTHFSLATRHLNSLNISPILENGQQEITLTLLDGESLTLNMAEIGGMALTTTDVPEVNYDVQIENEQVYRFLHEVQYDLDDYNYSLVHKYATPNTDLDQPNPIVIRLEADSQLGGEYVLTSETDDFTRFKLHPLIGDSLVVWNVIPEVPLYYRIYDADGRTILQQGKATAHGQLRMIYAPSVNNVRDMGGWPVEGGGRIRYGRLFRGAKLHDSERLYMSPEDSVRLRDLGIVAEFDLRGGLESGDGTTASYYSRLGSDITYYTTGTGVYAYLPAVKERPEYFRYGWNRIKNCAMAGRPIFYHCSMGCDRAGTWSLVLGGYLGMSEHDLNLDYELSTFCAYEGYNRVRCQHLYTPDYDFGETVGYLKSLPGETLQQKIEYFLTTICSIPIYDLNRFKAQMIEYPEPSTSDTPDAPSAPRIQ